MISRKFSGIKDLGLFNVLMLIANFFFILFLLLSYLAVHQSPQNSWLLPFFGILYPYFVIINLFFLIYWLLRRRWLFILSAVTILAGWNHPGRNFQFGFSSTTEQEADAFKLVTYNVKNLSNDNVDLLEPQVRRKIIGYLSEAEADIACLQEFSVVHPDPDAFIDSVSLILGLPYHAYSQYSYRPLKRLDAIFIFSKFPIIHFEPVRKDDMHNFALLADILIGKDTVRLFNVHLESIRLRQEDYTFISEFDLQFDDNENIKEGSGRILKKLKKAFALRSIQVDYLSAMIRQSPYPVILCGDFNDTPNSYTYQKLSVNMNDSYIESGKGLGNTYIGNLPSFRIDYILYSNFFTSWSSHRDLVEYSDHYPVSCYIGIRKNDD